MKPWLAKHDIDIFYEYLSKSSYYFEFGSGGSTYQAATQDNVLKMFCVESDESWLNKVKDSIENSKHISKHIEYLYCDLKTKPNSCGNPGKECTDESKRLYGEQILKIPESDRNLIDMVFIDGRFRAACCLKAFNATNKSCVFLFDDFLYEDRIKDYGVVLDYFEIEKSTEDRKLVVLRKKKHVDIVPDDIIRRHELNPR